MALVSCVRCTGQWCDAESALEEAPAFCPRRVEAEALAEADRIRRTDADVKRLWEIGRSVETDGYRVWPRVQELIEFSTRLDVKRIGVAFCAGLRKETESLVQILESHGFEVASVACTVNTGCNPVGQAHVLNAQKVDIAVVMGLCLGHDMLFHKFVQMPVTNLVVKDRVTCHNPSGPLLNRYWLKTLVSRAE
jgi:uncharacterized metal-binding protein